MEVDTNEADMDEDMEGMGENNTAQDELTRRKVRTNYRQLLAESDDCRDQVRSTDDHWVGV